MSGLSNVVDRLRGLIPESLLRLRAPYPPVALAVDGDAAVLVRLKRRRRAKPLLEACVARPLGSECIPASIFQTVARPTAELAHRLQELFELSGTRPSRVSLVLPDNLAKVSLMVLPERPASPRQLDELVRSKMRRAVPFRLDEGRMSYQLLPGAGREATVLVLLVRRALVDGFEQALASAGARVGLIDICTPNLINLFRTRLTDVGGGDVALLNCTDRYFSLVIVREERLIFFRCKTFAFEGEQVAAPNGELAREVASSLSYYREKLSGRGIARLLVRSLGRPFDEVAERLRGLDVGKVEPLDPSSEYELQPGATFDPALAQSIAPAIGAAVGRSR